MPDTKGSPYQSNKVFKVSPCQKSPRNAQQKQKWGEGRIGDLRLPLHCGNAQLRHWPLRALTVEAFQRPCDVAFWTSCKPKFLAQDQENSVKRKKYIKI